MITKMELEYCLRRLNNNLERDEFLETLSICRKYINMDTSLIPQARSFVRIGFSLRQFLIILKHSENFNSILKNRPDYRKLVDFEFKNYFKKEVI